MGNSKTFFYSKKMVVAALLSAMIVLLIAFWYGGRKKWELAGLDMAANTSLSDVYAEKLKQNPDDTALKYNLAYLYYRQNRFDEAEKLLLEILGSSSSDAEIIRKASYNLGNLLFRLSEKKGHTQQAIELLKRSLDRYRAVIETDNERQQYVRPNIETDQDAKYNYAVAKNRLKILADQLQQKKETQQKEKEIFELLKEILAAEKQIQTQLQMLQSSKSSSQSRDQRNSLLKKRNQNRELLKVVKERVRQMIHAQPPPSSASPII